MSDLREYRASLQRKTQEPQPEVAPEVVQPSIPKPKIDLNAPPSAWSKIKLQKILTARTPVLAAAISPSGKTLVTGGERTLEIWDLSTDKSRSIVDWIPKEYPISYSAIAFHPDGQNFATNSSGVAKKQSGSRGCTSADTTSSFSWSCNLGSSSETISTGGSATQIWNVESGKQLLTFPSPGGEFRFGGGGFLSSTKNLVSFNREGTVLLAIAGELSRAKIWDVSTGKEVLNFSSSSFSYCKNATPMSPDGKLVATTETSESVDLYSVQTSKKVSSLTSPDPDFFIMGGCFSFSPDGRMVAFADGSGVTVWWLPTGEVLHYVNTATGTVVLVQAAIFSPDSQVLAVGNNKQAIVLYDMRSGKKITTLSGSFVDFHPSATSLITTEGSNVKIWSVP